MKWTAVDCSGGGLLTPLLAGSKELESERERNAALSVQCRTSQRKASRLSAMNRKLKSAAASDSARVDKLTKQQKQIQKRNEAIATALQGQEAAFLFERQQCRELDAKLSSMTEESEKLRVELRKTREERSTWEAKAGELQRTAEELRKSEARVTRELQARAAEAGLHTANADEAERRWKETKRAAAEQAKALGELESKFQSAAHMLEEEASLRAAAERVAGEAERQWKDAQRTVVEQAKISEMAEKKLKSMSKRLQEAERAAVALRREAEESQAQFAADRAEASRDIEREAAARAVSDQQTLRAAAHARRSSKTIATLRRALRVSQERARRLDLDLAALESRTLGGDDRISNLRAQRDTARSRVRSAVLALARWRRLQRVEWRKGMQAQSRLRLAMWREKQRAEEAAILTSRAVEAEQAVLRLEQEAKDARKASASVGTQCEEMPTADAQMQDKLAAVARKVDALEAENAGLRTRRVLLAAEPEISRHSSPAPPVRSNVRVEDDTITPVARLRQPGAGMRSTLLSPAPCPRIAVPRQRDGNTAPPVYNTAGMSKADFRVEQGRYKAALDAQVREKMLRRSDAASSAPRDKGNFLAFGKPGSGAPVRDGDGRVVANVTFTRQVDCLPVGYSPRANRGGVTP